jgi:hypothetical protein
VGAIPTSLSSWMEWTEISFSQDLQAYSRPIGSSPIWSGLPDPTGQTGRYHRSDQYGQKSRATSSKASLQAKVKGGGAEDGS